jgi:CheY-like chemotaxis protein
VATVLVIDDDAATRLLVQTVLAHGGHRVIESSNGEAGLQLAAGEQPDLILLDLSLPGMSGAEFLRTLRRNPRTQALRVALYTASEPTPALEDFMEIYGIAARLPKPSEPLDLIAAVERALASQAP